MMKKNDALDFAQGKIIKRATKPPQRFTPSTLLAGMKEIHKYVKDPAAKKQLKDVYGIGTEATRAAIIDDLIKRRFVEPEGKKKYLIPQPSAYLLIDILPDDLTYPDATAIWEDRLHSLSEGDGTLEDFLERQVEFTAKLCQAAEKAAIEPQGEYVCPRCKRGVMVRRHGKNGDFWGCSTYPKCRMTCDDKAGKPDLEHSSGASRINVSAESGTIYNSYSDKVDYSELPPPSYPSETEIADYYAGKF